MIEGEVTWLVKASSNPRSNSLRTTVPMGIVKQFKLKEGDALDWAIEARDGELAVVVRKTKVKEK